MSEEIKDNSNKKGTTEKAEEAKKTLSEATEIIISLLGGHSDDSKEEAEKEKKKPKYVVNDTRSKLTFLKKQELGAKEEALSNLEYNVEILENIEIKDVSKESKFSVIIEDKNGAYIILDMLDLKTRILDYDFDLEDFLQEKLFKLTGNKSKETREVAVAIAEYLSIVMYYEECYVKTFTEVGWDIWDDKDIFKYNKIYSSDNEVEECLDYDLTEEEQKNAPKVKVLRLIKGKNIAGNADELEPSSEEDDDVIEWCNNTIELMNYGEESAINSLLLGASMIGIVRQMLPYTKENNININIVGERASGKSTICHYLLSTFGNPAKLEGSFTDTINAVEKDRVVRPVLPYILDERMLRTEGTSKKNEALKIIMDIFREYEGKVKNRVGGAKEVRKLSGKRTCGPIISSSVSSQLDVIINYEDIGQFRRFMEFKINAKDLFAGKEMAERYERLASTNYGLGVKPFVQYIISLRELNPYIIEETYNGINEHIAKRLAETRVAGVESSSQRFALIVLCYKLLRESIIYRKMRHDDMDSITDFLADMLVNDNNDMIVDKSELIIEYLIENIVGKMTQVNQKLEFNLYNYIMKNRDAFYEKIKHDKNGEIVVDKTGKPVENPAWEGAEYTQYSYLGKLEESDNQIVITLIKELGLERILFSSNIASPKDIQSYMRDYFTVDKKVIETEKYTKMAQADKNTIDRILRECDWLELKTNKGSSGRMPQLFYYSPIDGDAKQVAEERRKQRLLSTLIIIDKQKYEKAMQAEGDKA